MKGRWLNGLSVLIQLLAIMPGYGQEISSADSTKPEKNFMALPVVYYTPETRWVFGATGVALFQMDTASRVSSAQAILAYTQNKQVLAWLPYQLFLYENNYWLNGQIAYFRYPYFFNGIGNEVPENHEEKYTAEFPRISVEALRKVFPNTYAGVSYWFQNTSISDREEGMLLDTAGIAGSRGGITSGLGWVVQYDNRDNQFFPSRGNYIRITNLYFGKQLGSDFRFDTYKIDIRKFFAITGDHILAWQGYGESHDGLVPFNRMALLGGDRQMRGYRNGIYRDKTLLFTQLEYRTPLLYNVFGLTAFVGYGGVEDDLPSYHYDIMRWSYGAGFRMSVNPKQKLNLRIDYGRGEQGNSAWYLTVGEAF